MGAVGRTAWVQFLLTGGTEVDVMRGIISSSEYANLHPSNQSFLVGLYAQVLGRSADATGEAGWLGALQNGTSRAAVAQAFLTSAETDAKVIDQFYLEFLNRPADPAGEAGWLKAMLSGQANIETVAEGFLNSSEFFARFLQP